MIKVKRSRTADCVVAGFRYETNSREAASLLLGLYDEGGKLDHVGLHLNDHGRRAGQLDAEARRVTQAARLYR
jgi:ATP-dependent DNA ligase